MNQLTTSLLRRSLLLSLIMMLLGSVTLTSAQDGGNTSESKESITFHTTRKVGAKVQLSVKAKTPVKADGLKEPIVADGALHRYTLTKDKVSVNGDITNFTCTFNEIDQLDITKASSLDTLKCGKNILTSLDISKSSSLKNLDCWNNKITALDLASCPQLVVVHCARNNISELDLSKSSSLEFLDCARNQISRLDFSKTPKIRFIYCSCNKIKATVMGRLIYSLPDRSQEERNGEIHVIDSFFAKKFGDNVCLKKDALEAKRRGFKVFDFNAPNPKKYEGSDPVYPAGETTLATALKVGDKVSLSIAGEDNDDIMLEGLREPFDPGTKEYTVESTTFTIHGKLTELDCSKKKVSSISVSADHPLLKLNCSSNELTTLDLTKAPQLQTLECQGNKISEIKIATASKLEKLSIYNNAIQEKAMSELIQALPDRKGQTAGLLYAISKTSTTELNKCPDELIKVAKDKNWELKSNESDNVSVEAPSTLALRVYPNPAKEYVHVAGLSRGEVVALYSSQGELLQRATANDLGSVELDLHSLPDGAYILKSSSESTVLLVK